jgi:uncharacterized protein
MLDPKSPRHEELLEQISPRLPTDDLAHDRLHVLRVYAWAVRLAPEAGADPDLAGAAALVHDLVNVPKEGPDRSRGGELSARAAEGALAEAGYTRAEVVQITEAVRTCSWSSGSAPAGPLGQVLQDADRLDAIGAVGIVRTFATAQAMVNRGKELALYDPVDPLARRGREADDRRFALDHFMVKLLRLAEGMHLPAARAEALERQQVMQAFLERLDEEL